MSFDYQSSHARFAAQFWARVGAEPVARSYARALLGAATKFGVLSKVREQFDSLLSDVFSQFPKFQLLLDSPAIPFSEKEAILDRVIGRQAEPIFLNFLKVVVRHGRVPYLGDIYREFCHLEDETEGRISVEVTTAVALSEEERGLIIGVIRRLTNKEPKVQWRVEKAIIGGVAIRIGDKVYDASVRKQLQLLERHLVDRGIHEIQS
jgi:F-type H+-transporting ATPase subunit delta